MLERSQLRAGLEQGQPVLKRLLGLLLNARHQILAVRNVVDEANDLTRSPYLSRRQ